MILICIGMFTFHSLYASKDQSVYAAEPCTTPTPSASPSPTPTPTATPPVENIFLTEFMACPASGNEWLELYNGTDQPLTVTNWQIVDETGNKKYLNGEIPANDFMQFQWTGSLLNNTGDSFAVVTNTGQTIGTASYNDCTTGVSFVYENGEWVGALDTPGEETTLSQNNLTTSSAAATLFLNSDNQVDANTIDQPLSSPILSFNTTSFSLPATKIATPTPSTIPNVPAESQPYYSSFPAYSVIIGGLVQLLPSSAMLYGNVKKYLT